MTCALAIFQLGMVLVKITAYNLLLRIFYVVRFSRANCIFNRFTMLLRGSTLEKRVLMLIITSRYTAACLSLSACYYTVNCNFSQLMV